MLEVKQINDQATWETFLSETKPDTFLQSWQWGECNEKNGTTVYRLGVYDSEQLLAVALILAVRARRGNFLLCPHGPVFRNNDHLPLATATLTAYLEKFGRANNFAFIRLCPILSKTPEHCQLFHELGYRNAPIHMAHPELAWILDVTPSEEELMKGMRKSTRYSIKKAEKDGVTVSVSTSIDDFETFWQVYQATVTRQHFTPFSKAYLRAEFETFAKDNNAAFFFANYKGEVTATALIIFDKTSGYYHHGATTQKYPGLTDAQLLQWEIIKECKLRGLKKYNFWGVVPEEQKNHPWTGLSTFKRGFGGYEQAYVHAKDLPLSPRYWLNYVIERVRRWKRRL